MRKLLLIALFACLAFSCEDEIYSTIPWAPVNFKLNLNGGENDGGDSSLNGLGFKTFTQKRASTDEFGYGGLLVINVLLNGITDLRAYDLSCPNEAQRDVRVIPDNEHYQATCPKCGAKFNILSSGAPASGSKYPLKQYNVSKGQGISGTYVVTN